MHREYKNNMRERAWNLTSVLFNRPHSIHKCSNMAPSFSGKNKFLLKAFFVSMPKGDLNTNKTPSNIENCPEIFEAM